MFGRKNYTPEELDQATKSISQEHLDRYFVHRLRIVTGKDGNPLNEVELMTDSVMNNGAVLRGNSVIKFVPEESVLKLKLGDKIKLTAAQFERLSKVFLAEIQTKFL